MRSCPKVATKGFELAPRGDLRVWRRMFSEAAGELGLDPLSGATESAEISVGRAFGEATVG